MGMKKILGLLAGFLLVPALSFGQQTPGEPGVTHVICDSGCAGSGGGGTVDQGTPATTSDAAAWPFKIVFGDAQIDPRAITDNANRLLGKVTFSSAQPVTQSGAWSISFTAPQHVVVDNAQTVTNDGTFALETGGNLASIKTNTDKLDIALSALRDALRGTSAKTLTDVVNALGSLTVAISGSVVVTGPLTDTQLRATPVPVSGTVAVSSVASALPAGSNVIGHVIADSGSTTAVTGTVTVSGTVTANAGTNLNTSLLATSANQTNAGQKTQVVDGSGNVVSASSNALDTNFKSGTTVKSTVNSSTATLANNATFTGTFEDVSTYASITVNVTADSFINGGTLKVYFSSPGVTGEATEYDFYIQSDDNVIQSFEFPVMAQKFAVAFLNDSGFAQSVFHLETLYHAVPRSLPIMALNSSAFVDGSPFINLPAVTTHGVMIGADADLSVYTDVRVSRVGSVYVANYEEQFAKETGGNLQTVKTNTAPLLVSGAGGYVRQDSTATIAKESGGNLATVATNTAPALVSGAGSYVRQDSTGTIAKETGGNLASVATNTAALLTNAQMRATPVPVSGTVTATAANTATVGSAPPTSVGMIGGVDQNGVTTQIAAPGGVIQVNVQPTSLRLPCNALRTTNCR